MKMRPSNKGGKINWQLCVRPEALNSMITVHDKKCRVCVTYLSAIVEDRTKQRPNNGKLSDRVLRAKPPLCLANQ